MVDQLGSRSASERVAALLRRQITSGELPPGAPIRQRDVALQLQVSTTPVREALATLEREGLVTLEANRGAVVFRPSGAELRDHYEIRIALEMLAARKAAAVCTEADAARLQAILDDLSVTDDPGRFVELDRRFHAELYDLGGNRQLNRLIASLRDRDGAYGRICARDQAPRSRLNAEHQRILDTCAAGDADACARAIRVHLQAAVNHVTRLIERASRRRRP